MCAILASTKAAAIAWCLPSKCTGGISTGHGFQKASPSERQGSVHVQRHCEGTFVGWYEAVEASLIIKK